MGDEVISNTFYSLLLDSDSDIDEDFKPCQTLKFKLNLLEYTSQRRLF